MVDEEVKINITEETKENSKSVDKSVDKSADEKKEKTLSKFVQLKDINLEIKKGEFVCIVGDVGSGKSSLLHAVIGDMIFVPQAEID